MRNPREGRCYKMIIRARVTRSVRWKLYSTSRGRRCRRQWKSILDGGYFGASSYISLDMNLRLRSTCRSSPFGFSFLVSFVLLPATSTVSATATPSCLPSHPQPVPSSPLPCVHEFPSRVLPRSLACFLLLSFFLSFSFLPSSSLPVYMFIYSLHFARKKSSVRISQSFVDSLDFDDVCR